MLIAMAGFPGHCFARNKFLGGNVAIIVEGFDNSGKSTLAKSFNLEVIHPGPAPKGKWEEIRCLSEQAKNARLPVVLDRVTCISSQVYAGRMFDPILMDAMKNLLDTHHCIVIYCRPPIETIMDFRNHTVVAHDNQSQINWMQKNALRLVGLYDQLMNTIPHMLYDWTNPDQAILDSAFDAQFTIGAWRKCQSLMKLHSRG
jgi:hypothetical protein